ncbi:KR domain-containing protein [Hypoxylon cercidicola]|nr:KR domain-containing protein [Hypoxylon cercidicola]
MGSQVSQNGAGIQHEPMHDLLGSRVPEASKLTATWCNFVDINETSWLQDYRLGPSIVPPASAYLAMGVEAICQVSGIQLRDCPGVEMRHFSFLKFMDFDVKQRPRLEVVTEMRKAQVSSILASDTWWQFTVSSISGEDSRPTIHATGLVSLTKTAVALPRTINLDRNTMEKQAARVWYERSAKGGMSWGPKFTVMEDIYCDHARQTNESLVTTHLLRGDQAEADQSWQYIAHPISIDSLFQAAFVATTGGWVRKIRATIPTQIDKVFFSAPSLLDMDSSKTWAIDAKLRRVGFGTFSGEAELYNTCGETLIRFEGARCIAYQGNMMQEAPEQRNPMYRVAWKPDVMLMDAGANPGLTKYTDWFVERFVDEKTMPEPVIKLAGALEIFTHKKPKAHILLLNVDANTSNVLLRVLKAGSPMRRFETITNAAFSNGKLHGHKISSTESDYKAAAEAVSNATKFDIIFSLEAVPTGIQDWMATSTTLVTGEEIDEGAFAASSVKAITGTADDSVNITVISERRQIQGWKGGDVVMVNRTGQQESALDSKIHEAIEYYFGCPVPLIGISQVGNDTIPSQSMVISTIESEEPILSTASVEQMRLVKTITDQASLILWVCHGDFMAGTNPDFAPVLGLSRTVMVEQPSLQFAVFDIDDTTFNVEGTAYNACKIIDQLLNDPDPEFELSQNEQTIHSVRWEPVDELNAQFRVKQNKGLLEVPVEKAGRCQLHISQPGQMDSLHFVSAEHTEPLPPDHVEIEVKSVGVNAKDLDVLSARVDTQDLSCSCECAGVIVNIGSNTTNFKLGDRVVAMAPGHFATHERISEWAVCKLEDNEDFATASSIPVVFSTAIYSLVYCANLQRGESVLTHCAAGGVGLAAVQLAKHIGAEVFATVGDESKRTFLVKKFGLDPTRIFSSRDSSFLSAVMKATNDQGVDVVLNSFTGELLRSSFEACADFGRFVEIGKRYILDHGSLDMATFGKNVSFIALDLSKLAYSQKQGHRDLWQKLLVESMSLVRDGTAKPCFPIQAFRASEITQAFRHFSSGARMGKVTVTFEDGADRILVRPRRYETTFPPNKNYLMVGCLGGIGRSISRWMISCGARSLVFLGRSGLKKPEAKSLVDDLLKRGVRVEVVRGDVSEYDDVEKSIKQAPFPIGGVIHAAMGLGDALWTNMTHSSWHASIAPKVRGAWNLHNALEKDGRDSLLDFFILTSSMYGTIGTATQGNYCAANSFLDAFARYRNRLGRPAISIGYGVIAEILDLAIAHQLPSTWAPHYDSLAGAHIMTGIEFVGLKERRKRGHEVDNYVFADPRASLVAAAFDRSVRDSDSTAAPPTGHRLFEVAKTLAEHESTAKHKPAASVSDAVQRILSNKIAYLTTTPAEQLRPDQKLGRFGIDSALASELKTSIFYTFEVIVPYVTILDKQTSVRSLTKVIVERFKGRKSSNVK